MNSDNNLTLDDIANTQFGVRLISPGKKFVVTAPAAPDAIADEYVILEDDQVGSDFSSNSPLGTIFQVLSNDTDADNNTLKIIGVRGVDHDRTEMMVISNFFH